MPAGRPSALTDEVSAELCRLVGDAGLNEKDACTIVGITQTTLINWKNRGADAKTGKFFDFLAEFQKAQQRFKETHLNVIIRAATESSIEVKEVTRMLPDGTRFAEITRTTKPPTWQPSAWLLERKFPGEFSRRQLENVPAAPDVHMGVADSNAVDPGLSLAAFAEDVLGVHLSDTQLAMAALVLANQRTAIAGCHASGKTYLFAILVLWWLYRYDDGIVSIIATRELQTDHLWGWVTTFWNTCPRIQSALGSDARLLTNSLTVSPRRYAERTAAGVSTTGGVALATGIQGIHSEHVLHVFEEADGIHDAVYRAKEGSMTSVGNKLAMLFNPLRRTGPAHAAMRSDQFAKMNISGFDSPNLAGETLVTFLDRYHADPDDPWFHEPDVFPGLTGRLWLRDLYRRCGQWEDQEWYGRGLGAYAPSALNSIFDVELVHALVVPQEWEQQGRPVQIGIDWAAGRGGDLLAIAVSQPREDGYHLVDLQYTNYTDDTLEWMIRATRPYLYHASNIAIDFGGGGAEFYSRIRQEVNTMTSDHKPNLVRVNFGAHPMDDDSYQNRRAEIYFGLRHIMRARRFHANLSPDLQEEFVEQTYEWTGEDLMRVLSKKEQAARGMKSPDRLEAICLSVAPVERWRRQSGKIGQS